jgi:hypothetical protein
VALNERATPPLSEQHATAQSLYAALLDWGARIGFLLLVASFTVYLLGWRAPHVPVEQLPGLWGQPAAVYLQLTATPTGWGWLGLAHKADLANFLGIALLAACSLPPLLAVIPLYLKQRDRTFAVICALEVAVILLAASGVLTAGH